MALGYSLGLVWSRLDRRQMRLERGRIRHPGRPLEAPGELVQREHLAAGERVDKHSLATIPRTALDAIEADDEVAWKPDPPRVQPQRPGELDVDERERDRQAGSPREHVGQQAVAGIIVVLGVPVEAQDVAKKRGHGEGLIERRALGESGRQEGCREIVRLLDQRRRHAVRVDVTGKQRDRVGNGHFVGALQQRGERGRRGRRRHSRVLAPRAPERPAGTPTNQAQCNASIDHVCCAAP